MAMTDSPSHAAALRRIEKATDRILEDRRMTYELVRLEVERVASYFPLEHESEVPESRG